MTLGGESGACGAVGAGADGVCSGSVLVPLEPSSVLEPVPPKIKPLVNNNTGDKKTLDFKRFNNKNNLSKSISIIKKTTSISTTQHFKNYRVS